MRLLMVTRSFAPHVGGVATWAYEVGRQLAARCADFALVTPRADGGAELDRSLPFEVLRVPCTAGTFAGVASATLGTVWRRRRFDALLATEWQSTLPGLLWRRRGGPPRSFAALQDSELSSSGSRPWPVPPLLYAGARERVLEQLDGVFLLSAGEGQRRPGEAHRHSSALSGGCDAERFAPGPGAEKLLRVLGLFGRPVLFSLGALSARSGVATVLHALRRLSVRHPELRYLIGGDGPERSQLERLAEQLRVAHMVRFLGQIPAEVLPDVYRLCNIYVSAERHELAGGAGLGLSLLEASASGKPVVATRQGAALVHVQHGQTGLLCAPQDATALAGCVAELLEEPARAQRLGEQGRAHVLAHARWELACQRLLAAMARPRGEERGVSSQVAAE